MLTVYMVLNHATDMVYIGQTYNALNKRMMSHRRDAKTGGITKFCEVLREFPWSMFEVIVLERFAKTSDRHADLKILKAAEDYWIDECNACDPNVGYNMRNPNARVHAHQAIIAECEHDGFDVRHDKPSQASIEKMRHAGSKCGVYGSLCTIIDPVERAQRKREIDIEIFGEPKLGKRPLELDECKSIHQAYGMLTTIKDPVVRAQRKLEIEAHFNERARLAKKADWTAA